MNDETWAAYLDHLKAGGPPFAAPFDATVRQAVEGYQEVITRLKAAVPREAER